MERRNILKPTKATAPVPETKPEPPSIEEGTFEEIQPEHQLEDPKPKETPKVEVKPKRKKKEMKPEQYEHLAKAREKSLETRRRKKEEQIRLKLEKEALEKELQELKSRFNQVPAPPVPEVITPKTTPAPPPQKSVMDQGIDYDLLADRIYGKFQNIQVGIRADERKLAQQEYEEKLRHLQQPRQPVPKISMYGARKKPNRAFDMSSSTGYHGMGNY